MSLNIKSVIISGKEVLPIIEGGKGVAVSNGATCGAFAAAGAVGTFSGANADRIGADGRPIEVVYHGKTRKEKHEELVQFGIDGAVDQARIAHEVSAGKGRIHMNVLWEMGGAERILEGTLEKAKGLIHGITCGAGMPYKVAEIAHRHRVYYYPIISSMRAFKILWLRAYQKLPELLGAVVYEDPWLAGGHNGLSNNENPNEPKAPYERIVELRKFMNEVGLSQTPIIMAGGVWHLSDWSDWLDNPEIGPIAFQFGTRPVVTQESPVSDAWKKKLLTLKKGDVFLNRFSPTGFYSSAVNNDFIKELRDRSQRQIHFSKELEGEFDQELAIGARGRKVYVSLESAQKAAGWITQGFTETMRTPDNSLIFVTKEKENEILKDQIDCMGCLSACKFSNWKDHDDFTTGRKADPRSFCIQKTLQTIVHGDDVENQLMFSGHNGYKFAEDSFYDNGFIPTIQQLVDRILTGK